MFKKDPALDEAIAEVYREMKGVTADSDEYAAMVKQLMKLEKLKRNGAWAPPSSDTALIVGGNLVAIIAILQFEKTNVLVSKAIGFLIKLR